MPKGHRSSRSQGYYRLSPVSSPTATQFNTQVLSTRTTGLPNTYYPSPIESMSSQQQAQQTYGSASSSSYPNGGPVQHPMTSYNSLSSTASLQGHTPTLSLSSIRPSSGAWTPQDDATLMAARAQGMNWAPIQQSYFPSKTPNACRKRHERLMERRSSDDFDGVRLESLAKCYMGMRREIWSGLANMTGEKWSVVEQKCMTHGLKNLQTSARSCARRERLLDTASQQSSSNHASYSHPSPLSPIHLPQSHHSSHSQNPYSNAAGAMVNSATHGYEDSGIALEELEAEYENGTSHDGSGSDRSSSGYGNHYGHGHTHSGSGGSSGSRGWAVSASGMVGGGGVMSGGMGGNGMNGAGGVRLPGMENMGIERIINRPNQGR